MSADITTYIIKKQTNEMKLTLTRNPRVNTPSKSPPIIKTPLGSKLEPSTKRESTSPTGKPIVVPPVPKLIPILSSPKTHTQIEHFFSPKSTSSSTPSLLTHSRQLHTAKLLSSPTHNSPKHRSKANVFPPRKSAVEELLPMLDEGEKSDSVCVEPPKPKKLKTVQSGGLPPNRVKTIMKTNIQSHQSSLNISQESLAVVTKAAELFIAEMSKRSCNTAREQSNKDITYNHLATSVQKSKELHFLHAVLPKKVLAKDHLPALNDTSVCNDHVNE